MTKEELRAQVLEKYGDLGALMTFDDYLDEAVEALAFLESLPDEELLSFIKNGQRTDDSMQDIEHKYIK